MKAVEPGFQGLEDPNKSLRTLAAASASAVLLYFGTGLHPVWWLLWFAPVPLLMVAPKLNRSAAFLIASGSWFIGDLNQWHYFNHGIRLPILVVIIVLTLRSVFFGLGILFARGFFRIGSPLLAALAFPIYWVAFEYLTEFASPDSTFGNLAYSQMDFLPVIQVASVTGIWGISFIVFLFSATVAVLLSRIGTSRQRNALVLVVGTIICVALLFGESRLRSNPSAPQTITVTLMAKDVPISVYLGNQQHELVREYADEIRRIPAGSTDIVVLPEKIARLKESELPEVDALFAAAAAEVHTAVLLGVVRQTPSGAFNESRFYSAKGELQATYDKHHLLPIEGCQPGDTRVILDEPSGHWGLQICKDMDFPALSRRYASEGAALMLVPAWDFQLDDWLHSRMAILRAVENGFSIARSARNGLLTLNDNRGRILTETATAFGQFVSVTGHINIARESTLYTRFGDWFAWLNVAAFVALLVFHLFHRSTVRNKTVPG